MKKKFTLLSKMTACLFMAFIIESCNYNTGLGNHLEHLKNLNGQILVNDNWKVLYKELDSIEERYLLKQIYGDTTFYLEFRYIKKDFITGEELNEYLIWTFTKEYKDNLFKHFIRSEIDTSYYYVSPLNNIDSLIFVVGKYYYLCSMGELSANQMSYFYKHEDSLRKVQGNELPALPGR